MSKKILAVLLVAASVGACTDSPVAPVDAEPQFSRNGPPSDLPAAVPGSSTIVALADGTEFLSTLVFALGYSDDNCGTSYVDVLSGRGQYTVFAPTNDAFSALIDAVGADVVLSCDVLPTVLAYHVTRGRMTSGTVLVRPAFRMLSGEKAAVEGTSVGRAPLNLDFIDISASNGVVHVVDAVLLPPSITGS